MFSAMNECRLQKTYIEVQGNREIVDIDRDVTKAAYLHFSLLLFCFSPTEHIVLLFHYLISFTILLDIGVAQAKLSETAKELVRNR